MPPEGPAAVAANRLVASRRTVYACSGFRAPARREGASMEQEPKTDPSADEASPAYEAPRVETVLGTGDLEREVMHGLISQM